MSWDKLLTEPITLNDDRVLRTLGEAAQLLLGLSAQRQAHVWVAYAAELLIEAADSGAESDVEDATFQVERALKREGLL